MDSSKIFIDTDNEITFILEKVLKSPSERVCLVVPDRASVFTSISSLKLIKRVVDKSSKLLIIVTLDENGADLAKKAGLIVVSRIGEISESLWEKASKSKFEVIKKQKRNVYYTDLNSEEEETTVKEEISVNDILYQELDYKENDIPFTQEKIEIKNIVETETPQVRIKVDDGEVTSKEGVFSLKNEAKKQDLEKPSENVNNISLKRVRKTANNNSELTFNFGEDISLKKK
jgi:hypothetical protein